MDTWRAPGPGVSKRQSSFQTGASKKYVQEHPEPCKEAILSHGGTKLDRRPHEHGSLNCIVAFLGEINWSRSMVGQGISQVSKIGRRARRAWGRRGILAERE